MAEIIDFFSRKRIVGPVPLHYRVQYLIDMVDSMNLLRDHTFTFPDGDTWTANEEVQWPPEFKET